MYEFVEYGDSKLIKLLFCVVYDNLFNWALKYELSMKKNLKH